MSLFGKLFRKIFMDKSAYKLDKYVRENSSKTIYDLNPNNFYDSVPTTNFSINEVVDYIDHVKSPYSKAKKGLAIVTTLVAATSIYLSSVNNSTHNNLENHFTSQNKLVLTKSQNISKKSNFHTSIIKKDNLKKSLTNLANSKYSKFNNSLKNSTNSKNSLHIKKSAIKTKYTKSIKNTTSTSNNSSMFSKLYEHIINYDNSKPTKLPNLSKSFKHHNSSKLPKLYNQLKSNPLFKDVTLSKLPTLENLSNNLIKGTTNSNFTKIIKTKCLERVKFKHLGSKYRTLCNDLTLFKTTNLNQTISYNSVVDFNKHLIKHYTNLYSKTKNKPYVLVKKGDYLAKLLDVGIKNNGKFRKLYDVADTNIIKVYTEFYKQITNSTLNPNKIYAGQKLPYLKQFKEEYQQNLRSVLIKDESNKDNLKKVTLYEKLFDLESKKANQDLFVKYNQPYIDLLSKSKLMFKSNSKSNSVKSTKLTSIKKYNKFDSNFSVSNSHSSLNNNKKQKVLTKYKSNKVNTTTHTNKSNNSVSTINDIPTLDKVMDHIIRNDNNTKKIISTKSSLNNISPKNSTIKIGNKSNSVSGNNNSKYATSYIDLNNIMNKYKSDSKLCVNIKKINGCYISNNLPFNINLETNNVSSYNYKSNLNDNNKHNNYNKTINNINNHSNKDINITNTNYDINDSQTFNVHKISKSLNSNYSKTSRRLHDAMNKFDYEGNIILDIDPSKDTLIKTVTKNGISKNEKIVLDNLSDDNLDSLKSKLESSLSNYKSCILSSNDTSAVDSKGRIIKSDKRMWCETGYKRLKKVKSAISDEIDKRERSYLIHEVELRRPYRLDSSYHSNKH